MRKHYRELKKTIQAKLRHAYRSNIEDLITPETGRDQKRFWSYIKSLKKDSSNISPLRENGILQSDDKQKAEILNRQFQSAFTCS